MGSCYIYCISPSLTRRLQRQRGIISYLSLFELDKTDLELGSVKKRSTIQVSITPTTVLNVGITYVLVSCSNYPPKNLTIFVYLSLSFATNQGSRCELVFYHLQSHNIFQPLYLLVRLIFHWKQISHNPYKQNSY